MDLSRSCGEILAGVKSSCELGIAVYKSSMAMQGARCILQLLSLEKLARTTQPRGLWWHSWPVYLRGVLL
eukprot:994097-Pyramimonas_sp.AAC.1